MVWMSSWCPINTLETNSMFLPSITSRVKSWIAPYSLYSCGWWLSVQLRCFDNGKIVYATWQSLNPEMELTLYSLGKGGQGRKESNHSNRWEGNSRTSSWDFGEEAGSCKARLENIWRFRGLQINIQSRRKKTGSFQVQVSVGSPYSKRALNLSSICRNDRKRNSHHYGNSRGRWSYLGQIGIWTRLDRPWLYNASGVEMSNQLLPLPKQRLVWI